MNEQHLRGIAVPNDAFLQEANGYLKAGKKVCINVRGTSMLPFLKDGDKVVLASGTRMPIRKGSIVLAHTHYGYVLHRVIRIKQDVFVLAGDANARITETTVRTEVAGVVEEAYRNGLPLHINGFCKRSASRTWMLVRPFGAYILGGYRRINKITTR